MGTKEKLLTLLEQNRGGVVSGQEAAGLFGVSRAAVWKAAQALRAQGVNIQSLPGGGYTLAAGSDLISEASLHAFMQNPPPLRVLEETTSTNLVAKQWALQGAPQGSMVVAARQTEGKGRRGRDFSSPPGGLYLSVILRPDGPAASAVFITVAAAVATCRAIQQLCGLSLQIKWVNDLFYQGKKCCGILCEGGTGLEAATLDYVVAGIGINYATPSALLPPQLSEIATSLYPNGVPPAPRAQLAAAIHTQLMSLCNPLSPPQFLPEYRTRSCVLGRQVRVLSQPPYVGKAVSIDEQARLIVQTPDGQRRALAAGEISIVAEDTL